jgi:hypothetical protein
MSPATKSAGPADSAGVAASPSPGAAAASAGSDRLTRWLTLGANLCVVLGLIILIVEVRQNAELTRAAMETGLNDTLTQIELSLANPEIGAAWVKSIRDPEGLSDVEVRMVESHLVAVTLQWDHLFNMERAGLAPRSETLRHIQNVAPYYFGSRHGKNWLRWQEAGWQGTPMMDVAGPIVEALDEDFMLRYLEGSRLGGDPGSRDAADRIEREAREFMQAYAEALGNRRRDEVAAAYAASGATIIFNGVRRVLSFEEIASRYRDTWVGPDSFAWRELAYQPLGPDTVLVTGGFDWGTDKGVAEFSYASVLQREQGGLRIRLEVESAIPDGKASQP